MAAEVLKWIASMKDAVQELEEAASASGQETSGFEDGDEDDEDEDDRPFTKEEADVPTICVPIGNRFRFANKQQ